RSVASGATMHRLDAMGLYNRLQSVLEWGRARLGSGSGKVDTDMAKQPTKCTVCGGSTDGTPSGIKKHEATTKHALAARLASKVSPLRKALDAQADGADDVLRS